MVNSNKIANFTDVSPTPYAAAIAYREAGASPLHEWLREIRITGRIHFSKASIATAESLKRGLDIAGSIVALVALSPVFLVTLLLIKLEDGGPVFFTQERVGKRGHRFKMLKFRSMVVSAEDDRAGLESQNQHERGVTFKIKCDPRVTRIGKWIRKFSIDEIPQFYNVLCGHMALVGPRPPIPAEVSDYSSHQLRRLRVKPGLTCLWQIGGRSEIDFEGQVRLDLDYIHSESIWMDLSILVRTIPAVIFGKGAY